MSEPLFDHVSLKVSDFKRSRNFYDAALKPLGVAPLWEVTAEQSGTVPHVGYGRPPRPNFWIGPGSPASGPTHVAFAARSRAEVDAFHAAAIAAGGRDNGPPGLRPHYDPNYYGAFILDPDGNNVEAVCFDPAA
jgi:catechol 2,3-dioxygenase-like lactoylglutathione lyase family enzyme